MCVLKVLWKAAVYMLLLIGLTASTVFAEDEAVDNANHGLNLETIEILDLETAQRIGLMQNPNLMAASERVNQASARVRLAQAAYWPTLGTEANYRREEISNNKRKGNVITGGTDGQGGVCR
jgi:outer membrane protein TolC